MYALKSKKGAGYHSRRQRVAHRLRQTQRAATIQPSSPLSSPERTPSPTRANFCMLSMSCFSSNSHKLRMICADESKHTTHTMRWQRCCATTNRLRWCQKYACSAATQNSHTTVFLLHCDERKYNCNTAIGAYLGQANVPLRPPRLCRAQKECKRQESQSAKNQQKE